MAVDYDIATIYKLENKFHDASLHRPMRVAHYEAGKELSYDVMEIGGKNFGRVELVVDKFVGGGFAGQVYRIKVLKIESLKGRIGNLKPGGVYAMKILVPPSGFSLVFRNALYWIGFQGSFQLQSNPEAAKAGAIWQKFIRRGAKIRFGDESAVVDIYATFIDSTIGSCGELSEWVDGRTWRLEVDDRLDWLSRWRRGKIKYEAHVGSPEYRTKYNFMHAFVDLLHDMGGHEFARQYEWSTCKSQPNCLKRSQTENDPQGGLVAVDFRAGLALLPFLPMSPGDFMLIWNGLKRFSLVQFDRGSIAKLEQFIDAHEESFSDMLALLDELKASEKIYRNSIPDITHNHLKLFYSKTLWSTVLKSAIKGWRIRNFIDEESAQRFKNSKLKTICFAVILFIPFLGKTFGRLIGRSDWRAHYKMLFSDWDYFKRAFKARMVEKIISWHRDGRIDPERASHTADSVARFLLHLPFSILPAGVHHILTDWSYAKERFDYYLFRPIRLYFNAALREEWLLDMVTEGQEKHILSDEDAQIILSKIKEPFIQKYLKSLAVHVCTLPVTQVVSVIVALIYILMHPEMPRAQAWGIGLGIIALFQVVPISPGSLVRGLYVLYLVIKERNFKDYNIAVFLGFFKYIGYLAFPIQMAYRYPELARFMAGHWANESVHIVPVFGESGALLEHWVYSLFYNWPLTIQRRIKERLAKRAIQKVRYWHLAVYILIATGVFSGVDLFFLNLFEKLPALRDIWFLLVIIPLIFGTLITIGFGGASLGKRFAGAALCGVMSGVFYTAVTFFIQSANHIPVEGLMAAGVWRVFFFAIFFTLGAILTEIKMRDPELP
jgi:hypothetical protein